MNEYRDRVAIVGLGYSPLTRRASRTLASLTVEACTSAVADAGLTMADIDGIATTPSMPAYGGTAGDTDGIDVVSSGALLQFLRIGPQVRWASDTKMMITQSVLEAVNALTAGACTHVLIWRALHMPKGRYSDYQSAYAGGPLQFVAPYGFTLPAAWAGMAMQRYFDVTGCTRESMGRFVVQNRANANRNPRAYFKEPLTLDQYMGARLISDPCCLYDCDIPIDGAVAMVLTTRERARDLGRPAALVTACTTSTYRTNGAIPWTLDDLWQGGAETAARLWKAAGAGPREMDLAEVYDGFSIFVYTWLESLGFCPRGEAFRYIDAGKTELGGELPINTSGCSLGEGRLHGIGHIAEAVIQLTGRGGERQVRSPNRAVVTVNNGTWGTVGFVLTRADW